MTNLNNLNRISLSNYNNKKFQFFNLFYFIYNSYNNFFLKKNHFYNLHNILNSIFPIKIKNLNLFINYFDFNLTKSFNDFYYCLDNGMSYLGDLKIKFCLSDDNLKEFYNCQYVYIHNFPLLTDNASFVINGIEKIIISKFVRSPGFYYIINSNNKSKKYLIKITPNIGRELVFFIDSNNLLFLKISNYKISIIYILRFLGLSVLDIINKFYEFEYIHLINNEFFLKIFYDYFINFITPYDIFDNSNNVVIKKNTLLNEDCIKKLKSLNIKYIKITEDYLINKFLGSDIFYKGFCIANSCSKINDLILSKIKEFNITEIKIIHFSTNSQYCVLSSILNNDMNIFYINKKVYKFFSDINFFFIKKNFFNFDSEKNYDLWDISSIRSKINFKLNRNNPSGPSYLNLNDFLDIIKSLILFKDGLILEDDMQSLNCLNLNLIGDFLYDIFKKFFTNLKFNISNKNFFYKNKFKFFPKDFLNFNDLELIIKKFFNFSKYSQFLDQINILSEFAHKRRVTFLDIPGISRDHSGFDVRDLNSSYYSRLCPVETPEGINIGLVGSLSIFCLINKNKDLVAPYYKVVNGKVIDRFVNYLSSMDENNFIFTYSSNNILPNKYLKNSLINIRCNNQIILSKSKFVNYIDVYPFQILSISTCLIPFIEYNDSNRALMASNMLRQALPCIIPERPIIGTGLEYLIGINDNFIIKSNSNGVIKFIDPTLIIVEEIYKNKNFFFNYSFYNLLRHKSSNQNTDVSQRSIVNLNDNVFVNDVLTDGSCTDKGELSLGQNILVAFMSWGGYNFEDSIIVSEKILHNDRFTSLENFNLNINIYNNDDFYEVLTNNIKSRHNLNNLNNFGIIKIGSLVSSFDLLIGKKAFYYKKKSDSNEIKILDSIFNKEKDDFVDSSYYLPFNFNLSEVVNVKIFFSNDIKLDHYDNLLLNFEINKIYKKKKFIFKTFYSKFLKKIKNFLIDKDFLSNDNNSYKINNSILFKMSFKEISHLILKNEDDNINFNKFCKNIKKYISDYKFTFKNIYNKFFKNLPQGVSKLIKIYFIRKKKLQVGDKMSGRHGNKGVVSKIVPVNEMPYMGNGVSIDIILNPLGVPSRMNLGQLMEVHLGFISFLIQLKLSYYLFSKNVIFLKKFLFDIFSLLNFKFSLKIKEYSDKNIINLSKYFLNGFYFGVSAFNSFKEDDLNKLYNLVTYGVDFINFSKKKKQIYLYDGRSGKKFENSITVGYMYIFKLSHLSQDKLHSRSVSSYSLITQQPLKGKSNNGGQRLGEMEIWALEAYGASYTLKDMLTIKSDDISGRFDLYKSIINNNYNFNYNIPESFYVLLNNINSAGVYVRFLK